ncbi:MAG TPA: TIGR04086 family membrane protein [Bacillota bacterium]|nr:TIGR04086 family membrane protein [Bacillota bacterium]
MKRSRRQFSTKQEDNSLLQEFLYVFKGSVFAVIITLIFIIIFSVVMELTELHDSIIQPVVQVIRVFSIVFAGAYAARLTRSKGWLKGAATGLLYILLVSLISILFGGKVNFDRVLLSDTIMALVTGAIGGAIGINLK